MFRLLGRFWPILALTALVFVFFWKVILAGMVPLPGDLLTGAYYPWHEYKYGYTVDVPVKNPLISDSFSQLFVWKKFIADSYKRGEFPLWNQYAFSGSPLLANYQSAALYIFNIFLLVGNFSTGWSLYIISGVLFSAVSMFLLLKTFKYSNFASLIGALAYGFSGYSICWMQFAAAGQALVWLPLLILFIEKFFQNKKYIYLLLESPILFCLITAGHFQTTIYGVMLCGIYFLYKLLSSKLKNKWAALGFFAASIVLGLLLASPQLLPTLELAKLSVRFEENYINRFNFGLMPAVKLITLFAPDFFGNPATGNFWGFFNYNETVIYQGVIALFAATWAFYNVRRLKSHERFFLFTAVTALLLTFDNPLGKAIYLVKIPFLSTAASGRVIAIFSLAMAILIAAFVNQIRKLKAKEIIRFFWGLIAFAALLFMLIYGIKSYYISHANPFLATDITNISVAFQNLILPSLLLIAIFVSLLFNKNRFFPVVFTLLIIFDLFRFGWKYTPLVPAKLVFPANPVLTYLKSQPGIFRIDKEKAQLLPPNTWVYYGLMSPSGYDPMALSSYSKHFYKDLNGNINTSSRYAELDTYNAAQLAKYNVKYLLAIKWDEKASMPGNILYYKIDPKDWKKVFETTYVAVLENQDYLERSYLESDPKGINSKAEITEYTSQKVTINYQSPKDDYLVLADTMYPGWEAKVNDKKVNIEAFNGVFRKVKVAKGDGTVEFSYNPQSFRIGIYLFLASAITWLIAFLTMTKLSLRNPRLSSKI